MIILDRLGIEMVVVKISGDWLVYSVGWRLITWLMWHLQEPLIHS